jgi:hypothetical protein
VAFPPDQFSSSYIEGENVYFTYVDKQNNKISGYKLGKDLVARQAWSLRLEESEKVVRLETQFQTSSSLDHPHFTPTAFSGENIIYKHLDSNIFALATASHGQNNTADLTVYLVNGVSGKVLHRYLEKMVRIDLPIDFALSENLFVLAFQRATNLAGDLSHQELTVTELYS